jgi:hypothetical protein
MRQLVIMQATGKFRLVQVSGNVFVRHLLESGLEKVSLLKQKE